MILDTKEIEKPIFVIVVLILAAAIAYAGYNYGHANTVATPTVVTVAPTPVPTASTTYLTNPVTISSMTNSGGFPQCNILEDSRIFSVPYSYYDELSPGDVVEFNVVNTYVPFSTIVYQANSVVILSHKWHDYDTYYYSSNNHYYRNDNHVTIEVTRDDAVNHGYRDRK